MKDCLEAHREDPGFSAECKEEFEAMMEARAADFRWGLVLYGADQNIMPCVLRINLYPCAAGYSTLQCMAGS